jgi:hypothetical protein
VVGGEEAAVGVRWASTSYSCVSDDLDDWGLRLRQSDVAQSRRVRQCDRTAPAPAYLNSLLAQLLRAHDVPCAAAARHDVCFPIASFCGACTVVCAIASRACGQRDSAWIRCKVGCGEAQSGSMKEVRRSISVPWSRPKIAQKKRGEGA